MKFTVKDYLNKHKHFNPHATRQEMLVTNKEEFDKKSSNDELRQVEEELDLYTKRAGDDPENKHLSKMVNYLKRNYNSALKKHYSGIKGRLEDEPVNAGEVDDSELVEEADAVKGVEPYNDVKPMQGVEPYKDIEPVDEVEPVKKVGEQ